MTADFSHWLPQSEAARRLGISERTLERRLEAKAADAPEMQWRPRPGRKPEKVYNPRDIERLTARMAKTIPAGSPLLPAPGAPAHSAMIPADAMARFLDGFTAILVNRLTPPEPPKQWLSMAEAAKYVGLSEALLRRLVRAGRLPYVRDGNSWKVSKAHLDNLDAISSVSELRQATADLRGAVSARKGAQA